MDLKVAIVTGAGTGIGKASAIALAEAGFCVGLLGRRASRLAEVAQTLRLSGREALETPTDVTSEVEVRAAFDAVIDKFGRLDLLFNNAGTNLGPCEIDEMTLAHWREVIDVNLTGAFLCAREAFRIMKSQSPGGGRIINNGSVSAHVPRPLSASYTASKHAITGLTRSLSLDGRRFNIACGQIDIGNAASDMTAGASAGLQQPIGEQVPEPVIDVADVARGVVYMATLPLEANVQFMTVMATQMRYIGRG